MLASNIHHAYAQYSINVQLLNTQHSCFFSMHHNKLETVWEWKNATVWPYYVMNVTIRRHCSPYREVRMTVCCLGS